MNVLIIGGTRFLGLHITRMLAERGDEVTVANRGITKWDKPDGVEQLTVDIAQPGALEAALQGRTFDAAMHMIAMSESAARAVVEPVASIVDHYIQCGSIGVYAPLERIPADETHPTTRRIIGPNTYTGFSHKVAADAAAEQVCADASVPLTILRPSAIIGSGCALLDLWGARNPECFQRFIDGKVISLPNDGRALIHFSHVVDLARTFVCALDHPEKADTYNICTDYAFTLNTYAQIVADYLGVDLNVDYIPMEELIAQHADDGKVSESGLRFLCEHMCCSNAKVKAAYDWEPQYSPEEAVRETLQWMLEARLLKR